MLNASFFSIDIGFAVYGLIQYLFRISIDAGLQFYTVSAQLALFGELKVHG